MDSPNSKLWTRISLQTCRRQVTTPLSQACLDQSSSPNGKRNSVKEWRSASRNSPAHRNQNSECFSNIHSSDTKGVEGGFFLHLTPLNKESLHVRPKNFSREKITSAITLLKRKIARQKSESKTGPMSKREKGEMNIIAISKSLSKPLSDFEELNTEESMQPIYSSTKPPLVKRNKKAVSHIDFRTLKRKSETVETEKSEFKEKEKKKGSEKKQCKSAIPQSIREKEAPIKIGKLKQTKFEKQTSTPETYYTLSQTKDYSDERISKKTNSRQKSSGFMQANEKANDDYFVSNRTRARSLFPNDPTSKDKKTPTPSKRGCQKLDLKVLNIKGLKAYTTETGPKVVTLMTPISGGRDGNFNDRSHKDASPESKKTFSSYIDAYSPFAKQKVESQEEKALENFNSANLLSDPDADEVVVFEASGWAVESPRQREEQVFNGEDYMQALVLKLKKTVKEGRKKQTNFENLTYKRQVLTTKDINNHHSNSKNLEHLKNSQKYEVNRNDM